MDIATNLLEQARERAAAEKLQIAFEEGDAEQLPYADGGFDVVMSMFGAMFAPRPELAARELLRVCRSGGQIAMANWRSEGFVAQTFQIAARHIPPPPGLVPPTQWGDEVVVRERFGNGVSKIETTRRRVEFRYPFGPKGAVEFVRKYFGPTVASFSRLDVNG